MLVIEGKQRGSFKAAREIVGGRTERRFQGEKRCTNLWAVGALYQLAAVHADEAPLLVG